MTTQPVEERISRVELEEVPHPDGFTYTRFFEARTMVYTDATETEPAQAHLKFLPGLYDHLKTEGQIAAGQLSLLLTVLSLKKHPDNEAARKRFVEETCFWLGEIS